MTEQFEQGLAFARQGRLGEAESRFAAVALAEPQNAAAHRMAALMRYQQGRYTDALEAIDAATSANPASAEPWVLRGVILHRMGRGDAAIASLTKATSLDPRDAQTWYNRGVLLGELGRFDEAVDSYDKALDMAPNADCLVNRAGALINLNRAAESLENCDRALAMQPGHLLALCNRGLALAELARWSEAVAVFDQILEQAPNLADTWNNRGTVLHDMKSYAAAVASFDRALALEPRSLVAWSNRGRSLYNLHNFAEARQSFTKALAVAVPTNAIEWSAIAEALIGLDRHEEAVEALDKALALSSGAAGMWSRRAHALHILSRFDDALNSADRALALAPSLSSALAVRGRILLEMNRIEEGLVSLSRSNEQPSFIGQTPHFKAVHDAEQRAYLASQGVSLAPGGRHIAGGERLNGRAVNPRNAEIVAQAWSESRPQIVVIDDLLTPEALEGLRRFCWGSTIWERPYPNGYLGALPESGFAAPLLAQIAEELGATFPTVIGDHGLRLLWGFKYDSRLKGINIHADQAAVNVNFWITPDEANLNPERGGLVIYDANAPPDWEAGDYNANDAHVWDFLKRMDAKPIVVPYRANRAVIFDSDLFHETDAIDFKEGYLNRRINVTMLFGRRTQYGG